MAREWVCRRDAYGKSGRYVRQVVSGMALLVLLVLTPLQAIPATVVTMGDSISEGVQSADASWSTQLLTYSTWLRLVLEDPGISVDFSQISIPFLAPNLFGIVGDPSGRPRLFPNTVADTVAVSGANLSDLLSDQANALNESQIDTELDLMLYPSLQTQIGYAEMVAPDVVLCWIGNNDVLGAATSFSTLDASQLTPVAIFDQQFTQLADRLGVLASGGTKVVFANIPNVTDIGFMIDRTTAELMLGFPVNLAPGEFTTFVTILLMSNDGNDGLVSDPNYVLDTSEVATIEARIIAFNTIIQREADRIGMPVVDINSIFNDFVTNPPVVAGKALTPALMQGLFSLDGIHPNLVAHGLITNEFIAVMNTAFGWALPFLPPAHLEALFHLDPNIDKDGDGRATGRLGAGLMETIAWLVGFTGDSDDYNAAVQ
jgi:lysophospholipase L1-like esterase